jgi:sensor c-di-GMP phosphodiesterase-like protein
MGWAQKIEIVNAVPANNVRAVTKKIWDGADFVELKLVRTGIPTQEQREWLYKTYGPSGVYIAGRFWDYSKAGDYAMIDEKIYMMLMLKWGRK